MEENEKKSVMAKEVAVKEIQAFVKKWDEKSKPDYEIEQDYPHFIEALEQGLAIIDENQKVSFKLKYPIKTDEGNDALTDVSFRTRIRPNDLANITKGLDIGKNQVEYTLRCFAYLTGQDKNMLNKLEKFDYKVIEQISTIFL